MNIFMVIFIIVAVLVSTIGTYTFYTNDRVIGSLVFLLGAILTFVFYGLRWFSDANIMSNSSPVQWPPYVNMCPDYLTYYKRKTASGITTDTCVDRIGVSKNNKLSLFPADGNVNNENDSYFFPLKTDSEDATKKRAQLCARAIEYGLTWEGVTDGETCFSPEGTGGAIIPGTDGGAGGATCA